MKFSQYKSDLLDALKLVSKAVAVKPQTPILSGIFLSTGNSQVELQANNFSAGTIARVPAYIGTAGKTCVDGKNSLKLLRNCRMILFLLN